jgi:L-2,4-diaminobutyrate decarboxylase
LIASLTGLVGFDRSRAGGVVTTGGSESNLMGLLLARERAVPGAARQGVPAGRYRIFASTVAHFSVHRAAGLLGLGEDAVVPVRTGSDHRLDPAALDAELAAAVAAGDRPVAVVATAGTTDLGAIDPLVEVAAIAARHGVWLHVDAAYGGGALFSDRLAPLLAGVERADSVGLDLHKLGWQPVAAGVFLARDEASLGALARRAEYLNPADDEDAGYASLLGRSLRTTRRPDALKIAVTLRALGRRGLGALVDRCSALARYAAAQIRASDTLELYQPPVLTTVVFRYRASDVVNAELRRSLLAAGAAVVGRTAIDGQVWLKLTLLNPDATEADIDGLLTAISAAGRVEESR